MSGKLGRTRRGSLDVRSVTLAAGTRLGRYEVVAPLGAGGMGAVYRARDTRLGRQVAVKVLPDEVAQSPHALGRFLEEARAVAALSHPNILALHDVGEEGGVRFSVAELLEGETLRALANRGALPVRRALEIAAQLAHALAAAHEKGIVHRDVKPENVFVTRDGQTKLLDFGLAAHRVVAAPADDGARTPTVPILAGKRTVAGTVAYMSPEQARGETGDHRTDQFSLGVVVYELLAGVRPFVRETAVETMAAILREEPEPLEKRAPAVPPPVRWLVERLLSKEAAGRYDSTGDLVRELDSLRVHVSETVSRPAGGASAHPWRLPLVAAALVVLLALAGVLGALVLREWQRPGPVAGRFEIRLPEGHFLEPDRGALALSPDGRLLVFSAFRWKRDETPGDRQLFVRPLDALEARPIPGTEGGTQPVFSPDGQHVAFTVTRGGRSLLKRVPVAGGTVQTVFEAERRGRFFGAAWAPGGTILFAMQDGPLLRVSETGGAPEEATTLDVAAGEVSHRLPHLFPDGRTVAYTALRWTTLSMTWENVRIYSQRFGEKGRALLAEGGSDGRWAPPGVLLFAREGKLLAAPLGASARKLPGLPSPIVEGVRHAIYTGHGQAESGVAHVALSGGGLLAWSPGTVNPPGALSPMLRVDPSGKELPFEPGQGAGPVLGNRVSPDGQRVLLSFDYPRMQAEVVDPSRGGRRRVTFDANPRWAIWGPGAEQITFSSDHEGPPALYTRRLDAGPEELETLWKSREGCGVGLGSWSRDGRVLAFVKECPTGSDVWLLEPGKGPRPLVATRSDERHPDLSPDGQWLLYSSNESGQFQVYARALSGKGGTVKVSAGIGVEPLWARDGASAYYRGRVEGQAGQTVFRVSVTRASGSLAFGPPEPLFDGRRYVTASPGHSWDVGPDGRFLARRVPSEGEDRGASEKVLSNRIIVDTGGVSRLVAGASLQR